MIRNKNTDNQTTQDDCSGEEIWDMYVGNLAIEAFICQ